jgi:hypothetical protein
VASEEPESDVHARFEHHRHQVVLVRRDLERVEVVHRGEHFGDFGVGRLPSQVRA